MTARFRLNCFAALLCAAASLLTAPGAFAWGCKGHQAVAYIAERHLTPEAKQYLVQLLKDNPIDPKWKRYCGNTISDPFADGATWPDDARPSLKNGAWHYIDIPLDATRGPLDSWCGADGCVTKAISDQIAILKDKNAEPAKRADAVRYIVHFIGDMHQPLHAADNDDHGGNCVPVQFFRVSPQLDNRHPEHENYEPNLHGVWDSSIVERDMEIGDPYRYASDLDVKFSAEAPNWQKAGIHIDDWAWESHTRAVQVTYGTLPVKIDAEKPVKVATCADDNDIAGRMLQKHIVLGDAYQTAAAPVVEESIAAAGVRLAMILNDAAKSLGVQPASAATQDVPANSPN